MNSERIIGIDFARAIAIFLMIIVNFYIVLGSSGSNVITLLVEAIQGKSASLFVFIAGVGIAISTKRKNLSEKKELKKYYIQSLKRALVLFTIGLLSIPIWQADILHFYCFYILITIFFIKKTTITPLIAGIFMILFYNILSFFLNYETGWNFKTIEYLDFWSIKGFFRNLFFNGFHPILAWTPFMLIGFWFGNKNLTNKKLVVKYLITSSILFFTTIVVSFFVTKALKENKTLSDFLYYTETTPMPPLIFFSIIGVSFSIMIVSLCIIFCSKYKNLSFVKTIANMGKLALTFYLLHVFVGMYFFSLIFEKHIGNINNMFSVLYALFFNLCCILISCFYFKKYSTGPFEFFLKKISK